MRVICVFSYLTLHYLSHKLVPVLWSRQWLSFHNVYLLLRSFQFQPTQVGWCTTSIWMRLWTDLMALCAASLFERMALSRLVSYTGFKQVPVSQISTCRTTDPTWLCTSFLTDPCHRNSYYHYTRTIYLNGLKFYFQFHNCHHLK